MNLIDLHVHSTISDGTFTPREVAFYAKAKGLSAIALTDHDSMDGLDECILAAKLVDLQVIPGIELTGHYKGKEIHILGYYLDKTHPVLKNKLQELVLTREARNIKMLTNLIALGFELTPEDLYPVGTSKGVLTRAHFAKALYTKGYASSINDAFDKYLSSDKPAYVKRQSMDYTECIDLIHTAGGIAVIAHPHLYKFDTDTFGTFIQDMVADGLDGIESIYPKYSDNETIQLFELCFTHNLISTGGCDFHGTNKPNLDIGTGYGHTHIPYEILQGLKHKWEARHL
ncbi:MAG: PHP domain-containing protein [Cellulosilyticaceae bacterium]